MRRTFAQAWTKRKTDITNREIERDPELFIAADVERHPIWSLDIQRSIVTEFLERYLEKA